MQSDRKKEHKKVLKYMYKFNKNLKNDEYIGVNRFRIDMLSENWYRFSDGSGGELFVIFKMRDLLTGNSACFIADNYDFENKIAIYLNDFLIRCSSGSCGHWPELHYLECDIHEIVEYNGEKQKK